MRKIFYAESLKLGYCGECDGLHFQLQDADGNVVAVCVLDQVQAKTILEECAAFVEEGAAARASLMARRSGRLQ